MGRMKRKTKGDVVFDTLIDIFMLIIIVVMLYPFLNQIAVSLSDNSAIMAGKVTVFPQKLNLEAYQKLMGDSRYFLSFRNTVFYTVVCTAISMAVTAAFAYPLSKRKLKGRNMIMSLLVFSMMFGTGGLIPSYMVVKNLGLVNSYLALILPSAVSIWNVIILKNFFQQIPNEIEESAKIDGAGNMITFVKIMLPLAVPSLAALTLFVAVEAWNTFFNALVYINDPNKKLFQIYLNDILNANIVPQGTEAVGRVADTSQAQINSDALKAAALMCATAPILIVYPFVQRYFMAGLMVGSVKG